MRNNALPYDPQAARALLVKAGQGDLSMKVWAMPVSRAYMPNAERAAALIQQDLAKIGVTVEIVSHEWGVYLSKSLEPERAGAVLIGWNAANGDPDNFLSTNLSCEAANGGLNRAFWCDQQFTERLTRARQSLDEAERRQLYVQAQAIFRDQLPWVPLTHARFYVPMSRQVTGFVPSPLGIFSFDTVDLTPPTAAP